jgi:multisubunit Na+/H+ antiporter MnhB subunit
MEKGERDAMDPVLILLLALFGFMLIGSIVAVETRDLLSSVICLGAVGFGTSVAFLLLGAPDLAITQVVVEVLVLVVLVRVVITRKDETQATSRSTLAVGSVMLVLGVLVAVMFWMLAGASGGRLKMRAFGEPLMSETVAAAASAPAGEPEIATTRTEPGSIGGAYLKHGLVGTAVSRGTGAANYVMGIVLDARGYDTLGEATVIFTAIVGAYAVLRRVGRQAHARDVADR